MFPLAFVAEWLQDHWWGFISRNYVVWPTFLLMNVFIALKGSHFWFSFMYCITEIVKRIDLNLVTLTKFLRPPHNKDCENEHCPQSISWTNGWILTKCVHNNYWNVEKKWLNFGALDLIFKVTPALWMSNFDKKNSWSAPYLLKQMMAYGQTTYCITGILKRYN